MKIAFITEMGFQGKVPAEYRNMRTEFAWMHALDADHFNIHMAAVDNQLKDYDHVFLIFPKGQFNLNIVGSKIAYIPNPYSELLAAGWLKSIKDRNKKVYYVQEGPHWIFTELEIADQINFYNMLTLVDAIFVHNTSDVKYYEGLVPGKPINILPTLMIENLIKDAVPTKEDKVIIGGNFARWYGGFESFLVAREFQVPIWGQTSHAMRDHEDQLIQHLPRVMWADWIEQLSSFKYAIHLMPTVAAGTFALNCAYLGIPGIGNSKVDTQKICHPRLSVNVEDLKTARHLAKQLKEDKSFYDECSRMAKENYKKYYSLESWKKNMNFILNLK